MSGPFALDGRVALVTGGASGIGLGMAELLAEAGAHVVIADINADGAAATATRLEQAGHRAGSVAVDLTDEGSIVAACADVVARFGTPWVLVNNAGLQHRELLTEATAAHWDRINNVNARGPFLMMREVARAMIAGGQGGRIVNVGSSGLIGQAVFGLTAYLASKGAVEAMSRGAAMELAPHGITVNTVHPGGVGTPGAIGAEGPPPEGPGRRMTPLGFCDPRDIASAVVYFASPMARYVTNQVIAVDAGFSIS
jgi:NAD(P)-dependent dehydrogenase (short-subunit alcohol dehydrogenase family)